MTEFRLRRPGQLDLEFEGEQIATGTTKPEEYWTEIAIYRTTTGRWVVEGQHRTKLHTPLSVVVCDTPGAVLRSLMGAASSVEAKRMALDAFDRAGEVDHRLAASTRLAFATSRADRPRWSEITIYQVEPSVWIVMVIGRSTVKGETDRVAVRLCDSPEAVVDTLTIKRKDGSTLTELALDALDEAGERDPLLGVQRTERI